MQSTFNRQVVCSFLTPWPGVQLSSTPLHLTPTFYVILHLWFFLSLTTTGLYLDAQAGLDYLHKRGDIDKRRIVVFGRSLGGAVAIHVASQSCNKGRIAGVIVENTFTSIPDMGSVLFKMEFLRWIPLFIVKNKVSWRHSSSIIYGWFSC